jgi:hypothetical protein
MLLLFEPYLTHPLHYRVSLRASYQETTLDPQMEIDHIIPTIIAKQVEYLYLNYEPHRRLIAGIGIAGQHHLTMSHRQQHDGGTSRLRFLLCLCRDQDRILSNQRQGAMQKRTTVARRSPTALRGREIEPLGKLQETMTL